MKRLLQSILHRLCPLGIPLAWLQLIGEKKRFLTIPPLFLWQEFFR